MTQCDVNEIIAIFISKNTNVLTDEQLYETIKPRHRTFTKRLLCDTLRTSASSLFDFESNDNSTYIIRTKPTVSICQQFLNGKCSWNAKNCNQLHLCRYFGRCYKKNCRFPHDFTRFDNQQIIRRSKCENIDPNLLVRFIQLHQRLSHRLSTEKFSITPELSTTKETCLNEENDKNCQVKVAYLKTSANDIMKIEDVEEFFESQGLSIQKRISFDRYEKFNLLKLEFDKDNDCSLIPRIPYKHTCLRMKRNDSVLDQTSFVLASTINSQNKPISFGKFSLYIDTLTEKCQYRLIDLSSSFEHVMFVQCAHNLNFDEIIRKQKSRQQLQGMHISLKRIYELDTIIIEGIDIQLSTETVENIIQPNKHNIFMYTLTSSRSAIVEFMDGTSCKLWLLNIDQIQRNYRVKVLPYLKYIEVVAHTASLMKQNPKKLKSIIKINLRRTWKLVVNHPVFGVEYKTYLESQLKSEIKINGHRVEIFPKGNLNNLSNNEISSQLRLRTQEFMRRYAFRTIVLEPLAIKLKILHENSTNVAFECTKDNTYSIAAKTNYIEMIMKTLLKKEPENNPSDTVAQPIEKQQVITENIILPFRAPAVRALLGNTLFRNAFEQHLSVVNGARPQAKILLNENNENPILNIVGEGSSIEEVISKVYDVFQLFRTITFNDQRPGNEWTKIPDAIRVIQHNLRVRRIPAVCEREANSASIMIHYVDKEDKVLGTDENELEKLCNGVLCLAKLDSNIPGDGLLEFTDNINTRADYGKDICIGRSEKYIILYGLSTLVKHLQNQYESIQVRVNLLMRPQVVTFSIDEPGFEVFIEKHYNNILKTIDQNCSLTKEIIHQQIQIMVPKSKRERFENRETENQPTDPTPTETNDSHTNANAHWLLRLFKINSSKTKSPSASNHPPINTISRLTIGTAEIHVKIGDLTTQTVDVIVVSSTSKVLCKKIVDSAGPQVKSMYSQYAANDLSSFETPGGSFPCKRIVFRPWAPNNNDSQSLKQSIGVFISSVITYAIRENLSTIAFPTIGCGQLGYDPKVISEHMIGETCKQLRNLNLNRMVISFIILPEQQNVYDAFISQLKMPIGDTDKPVTIAFDKQVIKFTLTGSNIQELARCKDKIQALAKTHSYKLHLTNARDMADWKQNTIQQYYETCLQNRVLPALDIEHSILDLIGPKDAVMEMEKYFYQLTAEALRNARLQTILHVCIWSVEVSPSHWKQYSSAINEQIENARSRNLPHIDIVTESSEKCRIIFSTMEEHCNHRKRRVNCKRIDSSLPDYWNISAGNFTRVVLLTHSKEYKDILKNFETTMKGKYRMLIKIERIQNERWYKQYAAHRDEFTQRYKQPDERLLFHGCSDTSANKIVQECFNRTFAGVNGVVYGYGVYFHEHAEYSHNYAKPNASHERVMFLARVLVGKTCIGNSQMKVPPEGFDTTTDGKHIFVVYHDAAAYGEYLITYK